MAALYRRNRALSRSNLATVGPTSLPLGSRNHVLLASEPAWPEFVAAVETFTGVTGSASPT